MGWTSISASYQKKFSDDYYPFALLALILLLIGYGLGVYLTEAPIPLNLENKLHVDNQQLQRKLSTLSQQHQIALQTKLHLKQQLEQMQTQYNELLRDVMLYRQLVDTKPNTLAIQIKSFQTFATMKPQSFRYLMLLSKSALQQGLVSGKIKMTIKGYLNNKMIELPVKFVEANQTGGLPFAFEHLQEFSGELTFPTGFIPKHALLKLELKDEEKTIEQTFNWRSA